MNNQAFIGYIFGILCAVCWAISPIFIRRGLEELPFPIWGTAIGLSAAAILYLAWFSISNQWKGRKALDKKGLVFQIIAGVASGIGIVFVNIALNLTTVVIVISIAQSTAIFTLILGPLIFRESFERITVKLVAGVVFLLGGSLLIMFANELQALSLF
jgi:uncharacterized membrane protein